MHEFIPIEGIFWQIARQIGEAGMRGIPLDSCDLLRKTNRKD